MTLLVLTRDVYSELDLSAYVSRPKREIVRSPARYDMSPQKGSFCFDASVLLEKAIEAKTDPDTKLICAGLNKDTSE